MPAKEKIYTIDATKGNAVIVLAGDKDGHSDMERVLKADLRGFMAEFDLEEEDLELDKLACHVDEPFCKYQLETPASLCTVPFAQKLLAEEQTDLKELLALDMRRNFRVSPVAVMHCRPNECLFEIPETVRTILHKDDHLVFLESNANDIKKSMHNLNSIDKPERCGIVEWNSHPLEGGAVVHEVVRVEEVELPPGEIRRGAGGSKS